MQCAAVARSRLCRGFSVTGTQIVQSLGGNFFQSHVVSMAGLADDML